VRAKKGPIASEVTDVSFLAPKIRARIRRTPRSQLLAARREGCKLPEIRFSRRVQETFSAARGGCRNEANHLPPRSPRTRRMR